jgi:NAD-dependent SIR2 family protein deacetylase
LITIGYSICVGLATAALRSRPFPLTMLTLDATDAPDGDADVDGADFSAFEVPACSDCSDVLKPDVVFFGENVPRERVERAYAHLDASDAILALNTPLHSNPRTATS